MEKTYTRIQDQYVKGKEKVYFLNKRGAKIQIDLNRVTADENDKNGLMSLWMKRKKVPEFIKYRLDVETYAMNDNGDFFAISEFEIISLSSEDIYYKNIIFYNLDLICEVLKKNKDYLYYYLGDDLDDDLDNEFLEVCEIL